MTCSIMHVLQVAYDVMDVDAPQFQADFSTFKKTILELEHRLGALIIQVTLVQLFRPWPCLPCWPEGRSCTAYPAEVAAHTAVHVWSALAAHVPSLID